MPNKKQSKIKPLGNRVLIEDLKEQEGKTASGIFIPDSAKMGNDSKKGKVIEVGDGEMGDGKVIKMSVKKGDTVLYSWGDHININDTEYTLVSSENITAIIIE